MKKFLSILLVTVISVISLFGISCSKPEKDKINVKYYANPADIVKIFGTTETIGLIPEPAATNLTKKIQKQGGTIYRLSLQDLYDSE